MKKILFATSHLPYPPLSGGRLREFEIIKRLCKYCEIYLCVVTKTYEDDKKNIDNILKYCKEVKLFSSPNTNLQLISQKIPEQISRNTSKEASKYIEALLKNESIFAIHLEGFYMINILPKSTKIPIILTEQNIEFSLWNQKYENENDEQKKKYYFEQYILTKKVEINTWKKVSKCVALTIEDRKTMEQILGEGNVTLVPNGIDHLIHELTEQKINKINIKSPSVIFVANFAYYPNMDAAIYFIEEIYPLIISRYPGLNIYFVGNDPNNDLDKYNQIANVHVTGKVVSLLEYYLYSDVFICPLRIGGGIKVKMLEAIFFGKAIVSTNVGAQGFGNEDEAIVINDDPRSFAESIVRILTDVEYKKRIESQCMLFSQKLSKWDEIVGDLYKCYMAN